MPPDPQENARMVARMLPEKLRKWSGFVIRAYCQGCREERDTKISSLLDEHGVEPCNRSPTACDAGCAIVAPIGLS